MTKSVAPEGPTSTVDLAVRSDQERPVRVEVRDEVPSGTAVVDPTATDGTAAVTNDGGGTVVAAVTVRPDERTTVRYHLDDGADSLPAASVERIGDVPDDDLDGATVWWEPASGDAEPLAVTVPAITGAGDADGVVVRATEAAGTSETLATEPLATDVRETGTVPTAANGVGVGFVVTRSNQDAAMRTAMRARQRGHPTIATYSGIEADDELLGTLESIGVTVVAPPAPRADRSTLNRTLSTAARERGMAGLVLQTADCPRIDYGRSLTALERADYEVVAIPERWERESDSPSVVVAIPAYNAARSIGDVVGRAIAFADEVVVVDDGSSDETAARAREAGATVVVHDRNLGYGGALKTAFKEAAARDAEHLVVIDADGQHDPADIPSLVETQDRDRADIVIGSRYVDGSETRIPLVRSIGLSVINKLTNVSLGQLRPRGWIRDTQSGYRAYSKRAVRSLAADRSIGDNMGASTDILYHAHRNRLSVTEVATTISYDVEEASSQGSLSHGLDLIRNILWTIEYGRPLLVVGAPGATVTLLAVFLGIATLGGFNVTGQVSTVHAAITVLFLIGGVLTCFAALVMHILNRHPAVRRLQS